MSLMSVPLNLHSNAVIAFQAELSLGLPSVLGINVHGVDLLYQTTLEFMQLVLNRHRQLDHEVFICVAMGRQCR